MGAILRGGRNYSNGGPGAPASTVTFVADGTDMKARDVQTAIIELYNVMKGIMGKEYTYPTGSDGQTDVEFLKDVLKKASRTTGGICPFVLNKNEKRYVGVTYTTGEHCSFTLHSVENPANLYYGYFDNMHTVDGFKIFKVSGNTAAVTDIAF